MVGLNPRTYLAYIHARGSNNALDKNSEEFGVRCFQQHIELLDITLEPGSEPLDLFDEVILKNMPPIIFIHVYIYANHEFKLSSYKTGKYDPVINILLNCDDATIDHSKNILYMRKGADIILSTDTTAEEIFLKCLSALRRKNILELNLLTELPSINKTHSILKHCIENMTSWSVLHLDTLGFKSYNATYGISKGDHVIKEVAGLLKRSCREVPSGETYLGHLGRDNFLIACDSVALNPLRKAIEDNFPEILSRIYKDTDYSNGYIVAAGPHRIRRRETLLRPNIGSCGSQDRSYVSSSDIIEQAIQNKKLRTSKNKKILILEDDLDFADLVAETFVLEGFEARVSEGLESLIQEVEAFKPIILILEAKKLGIEKFQSLCTSLNKYKEEFGLKILVATDIPGYNNFLSAGADIYLPKPYDLEVLFKEARRLRYASV